MQIADHYLRLREFYADSENEPFESSLEQLAEILCCTPRNVKLILRQLRGQGWIRWEPGRGRGNRSMLTLIVEPEQIFLGQILAKVEKGRYSEALELMRLHLPHSPLQQEVLDSLYGQFGITSTAHANSSVRNDLLRLPFYREMPCLDPLHVTRRTELHMVRQLFDTLVEWDSRNGTFLPGLAVHWEQRDGGAEWVFYLRKGVRFHNKKECTSADVRHTLMRLIQSRQRVAGNGEVAGAPGVWNRLPIRNIEAEHPYAVRIYLKRPDFLLLHYLAAPQAGIVPHSAGDDFGRHPIGTGPYSAGDDFGRHPIGTDPYSAGDDFGRQPISTGPHNAGDDLGRHPIGTGPYKLVRNDAEMIVLEAFTDYYRERAQLDRVEMWILKDLLTKKGPDRSLGGQPILYTHPFQIHPRPPVEATMIERTEEGCTFFSMNCRKMGPLQDPSLRRKLRNLLPPKRCVAELGGNRVGPAYSFFPDWSAAQAVAEGRSLEEALPQLEENGGVCHAPLQLFTHEILNKSLEQTAHWIQKQCASAGIPVEVHVLPYEQLMDPSVMDGADMLLLNAIATNNREWSIMDLLLNECHGIVCHLDPELCAELEQLCAAIAKEPDSSARLRLLQEVEATLLRHDALHFLYHLRQVSFYNPLLLGTEKINPYGWVDFRELTLRPEVLVQKT